MGVHVFGRACDVDALEDLGSKFGVRLVFDAAHALACSTRGRRIGRFGDLEIFSFHATKFINAFEGGALVTNDASLAAELKKARNFGFEDYDRVTALGINGKMSEASAAMGLTSLEALDDIVARNRTNHSTYAALLGGVPGVRVIDYADGESNYQYVVALVNEEETGLSRDDLVEMLHAENVLARKYFYPGCHRMEPYATENPTLALPVTDVVASQVVSLPTGTSVVAADIERVVGLIARMVASGPDVRLRLGAERAT
jgi:dTDP-4-amino-4,6-dideoxygalactose transaminase